MPKRPPAKQSTAHVALLRGINVGGKHMLPMAALAAIFQRSGCDRVRTYIQSGNVLFSADSAAAADLAQAIPKLIEKQFGFTPPVILRTAAELAGIAAASPLHAGDVSEDDHKLLHVGFLADKPTVARAKSLDPKRSPHDRFLLRGQDLYVLYTKGVAGTKLTPAYFDSTLDTTVTFRNWRTVRTLAELLREQQ